MSMVAEPAPDASIDVANGAATRLSDLWRERHLILWFSRGLACPFCRRQIVQFSQIQDALAERNTIPVQITATELNVAQTMLNFFPVSWIYACDPAGAIAAAYRLDQKQGLVAGLRSEMRQQSRSWGLLIKQPGEPHPEVLPAVQAAGDPPAIDGGMVIVDRQGTIRFKQPSGKLSLLPSNQQLLEVLARVQTDQI